MEKTQWIDKHFEAMREIRESALALTIIAKTLYGAGNDRVSDRLYDIAARLTDAERQDCDAISRMLTEEVNAGQKAIHDTFLAAIMAASV